MRVNNKIAAFDPRSLWIAGGVVFLLVISAVMVVRRGRTPSSAEAYVLEMKRKHAETQKARDSLNFSPLDSEQQITEAVGKLKLVLVAPLDAQQEGSLRAACAELLRINVKWDWDGYVQFCKKRDTFFKGPKAEKLPPARARLLSDPEAYIKDLSTFHPEEAFTDIALTESYISVASSYDDLPCRANPGDERYYEIFNGGYGGGSEPLFVSRVSSEELERQGYQVLYADFGMIVKHRGSGVNNEATAHNYILFWNPVLSDWVIANVYSNYGHYLYYMVE
jgi:hypothetical protein